MISTPAIESSSVGFIYLIQNGIIPFEVFTMINNFIFYFLEQILNNPCESNNLKQKWLVSIHKEIGHSYDRGLDDIFLKIVESSSKLGLTDNDKHEDKFIISITPKGTQAYADYLNQIHIPNSTISIARQSNKISIIAAVFSGAGVLIAIAALLVSLFK